LLLRGKGTIENQCRMHSRQQSAQPLSLVFVGHVDHGKSTLIGRLLFDCRAVPEARVEAARKACEAEGTDFEYAFLLDSLLEEQAQNVTIETTQIPFRSGKRRYVIIDAPGHREFLKNMVTGAARAQAAVLVVDAARGIADQTRRHLLLLKLLGIKEVVVAVNKMDLVGFSQEPFELLEKELGELLRRLGLGRFACVPLSAKHGHNIAFRSSKMDWYAGPIFLEALDALPEPEGQEDLPLRFSVQDVYRVGEQRMLVGRVESGVLRVGEELVFWPDRKRARVRSFEEWGAKHPPQEAVAGKSTAITLEEPIYVERGQLGARPGEGPVEAKEFQARLFWLSPAPLRLHKRFELRLACQAVEAAVVAIERVWDASRLEETPGPRCEVYKDEVAEVLIRTRRPLAFDNADRVPQTGRFVLFDGRRIVSGGIIFGAQYPSSALESVASSHISWTGDGVDREARTRHFGHRGAVLWLTGLSGSGKSTLALGLEQALFQRGVAAYVLDGDDLRHGLCCDLSFSRKDRAENIRRAAEVARLMAEAGLVVVTAFISPYRADRNRAREICRSAGIPFAEVYLSSPLEVCEARDPKGLYRKARTGEITGFTGVDDPYEPPEHPELVLCTDRESREESLEKLLGLALELASPAGALLAQEPGEGI
jgi:bifunctional enzyme CysN/CysC